MTVKSLTEARGVLPALEEFLAEADNFRSLVIVGVTINGDAKIGRSVNSLADAAYVNALVSAFTTELMLSSEEEEE